DETGRHETGRDAVTRDAAGRLDEPGGHGIRDAMDAARAAVRAGATDVLVVSLESADELPASPHEVHDALEEGIRFAHRRGPARILTENGKVVGLETVGVTRVFDEDGRFAPTFDESDRRVYEADTVILAIGQAVEIEALEGTGIEISPRRTVAVDEEQRTSLPGVWAGGDAARGPRLLIDAIADGRRAAASIHRTLTATDEDEDEPAATMVVLEQFHRLDDDYDARDRVPVPMLPLQRRIGIDEIETGYTPEQARCEASRCLRCFADIVLDPDACVLCGLCADICPLDLISLVPAAEVTGDPAHADRTALVLDETACIRCGLCIERCPPRALSMGVWTGANTLPPDVVEVTIGRKASEAPTRTRVPAGSAGTTGGRSS
ncbi:MAG: 4Fe-4S dicluster domain-containing protein, partial [Actinomyces sp.]